MPRVLYDDALKKGGKKLARSEQRGMFEGNGVPVSKPKSR